MNTTQKRLTIILTSLFLTLLLTRLTSGNLSTYGVTNQLRNSTSYTSEVSATTKIAPTSFLEKTVTRNQPPNIISQGMKENKKTFVGYYATWCADKNHNKDLCEPWGTQKPEEIRLTKIAPYVNMVILSFLRPDAKYSKQNQQFRSKFNYSTSGDKTDELTGLEFSSNGEVVKKAIESLKSRGTKVLVSVGGWGYTNEDKYKRPFTNNLLNPQAIADVVEDFGFDGVDICFEPKPDDYAKCSPDSNGKITCNTDDLYLSIVKKIKEKLPQGKLLTVAAWSTGAYGEGQWANSKPDTASKGLLLKLLRSPEAGYIDQLNVMSYEGGSDYNPEEALAAYTALKENGPFKGKIVMGIQVPPEEWPLDNPQKRQVYNMSKVRQLTQAVLDKNADGMMLWYLQRTPDGKPTEDNPNAEMISQEICIKLALGNCDKPLFSK